MKKKDKERYQLEKTKRLGKINKKLNRKAGITIYSSYLVWIFGGIYVLGHLTSSFAVVMGCAAIAIGCFGSAFILGIKSFGNHDENEKLIDKVNIQEETNKLDEEEKEIVKEISKKQDLAKAISYISHLKFDEDKAELLKNAVLHKNVLNTMKVLDKKECINNNLEQYDFDDVKLEQEYQNAVEIGTKSLSLKKTMSEVKKSFK